MNCQRFEEVVSELARAQMMEADLRLEALDHSGECRACRTQLRDEEMLTRSLRALAVEMKSAAAPDELESRLLEVLRTRRGFTPVATPRSRRRYWLSAAAAVLLIVFGAVAVRWRSERSPGRTFAAVNAGAPMKPQPNGVSTPAETAAKLPNRSSTDASKRTRGSGARIHRPRVNDSTNLVAVDNIQTEVATEFMPVGYLSAANLQDGGQIVRVELPRYALAGFGVPVNMDRYHEKVKADVLLGVDGLAHAIRFVH